MRSDTGPALRCTGPRSGGSTPGRRQRADGKGDGRGQGETAEGRGRRQRLVTVGERFARLAGGAGGRPEEEAGRSGGLERPAAAVPQG